jgi:HD superfamily phosphohydrolase
MDGAFCYTCAKGRASTLFMFPRAGGLASPRRRKIELAYCERLVFSQFPSESANMSKRAFIKDPLWGNIEIFSWETCLTNHFIINRLTNIIQNSSAFRAYPGLKYSRFLHSLGVVHVVTHLSSNAIRNAQPEVFCEFKKEADEANKLFSPDQIKLICGELVAFVGQHSEFAALLAILRTCAFIHDLGHLPYSHVFENALEAFLTDGLEKTIAIHPDVVSSRKTIAELIHKPAHKNHDHQQGEHAHELMGVRLDELNHIDNKDHQHEKIHELVGVHLADALANELAEETSPISKLASSLIHAACQLLRSRQFPIAMTFIKGVVDADRIDFTRRDGAFSGLFHSAVDYDRLFMLYTLEKIELEGDKKIVAQPSIRANSETEKLLWERFQDYKYIVMHHKVHMYDEVVENIIVHLLAGGRLHTFLKDLIKLLQFKISSDAKGFHKKQEEHKGRFALLSSVLLQFDDPWLESHIRSIYREILEGKKEERTIQEDNPPFLEIDHDAHILFEVYVEDRRRFISAFKSDSEFWDAVGKHARTLECLLPKGPVLTKGEELFRQYFFDSLYAGKFALQDLIMKKLNGVTVLIGPTERKVNFGVRDEDEARSYQVNDLVDYLKHKKYGTMLFNLWFDRESGLTRASFLEQTMPIIEKFTSLAIVKARAAARLLSPM